MPATKPEGQRTTVNCQNIPFACVLQQTDGLNSLPYGHHCNLHTVKSIRCWEQFPIDQQIDGPRFVPNREAGMSLPPTTRTPLRITTIPYTMDIGGTMEGKGKGMGKGKCLHWRLVTVKAWIAIYVLLASKCQNILQVDRMECKISTVYLTTLSQLHMFYIYIFERRVNVCDYLESLRKGIKLSLTLVVSQHSPRRTNTNGQSRQQTCTEIEHGTPITHQRW